MTGITRVLGIALAIVGATLAVAPGASAQSARAFLIDPRESSVSLAPGSRVLLDFGIPGGAEVLPLTPAGPSSTPVRGVLRAQVETNPLFPSVSIEPRGTLVVPANSGDLLPGLPGDPGTAAPGQLAATFAEALFGIQGAAAVRGAAFHLQGSYGMEELAPGRFGFPAVPAGFPQPTIFVTGGRGDVDVELDALGLSGRAPLTGFATPELPAGGLLEDLGNDRLRLTLPLELRVTVRPFLAGRTTVELALAGRIVAYSPVLPVPEAGGLVALCSGLLALAALRRARAGGG